MPITIYSRRADNVSVISIIGRFTVGEDQHDFRLRTREILSRDLDLAELSFADSAALGENVAAHTAAATASRLDSLFESFDSKIDALATY